MAVMTILKCLPSWVAFLLGTEDMISAYRQHPVLPSHYCVTSVAFWHKLANAIRYIILLGMPFGMSSAVINFCRTPALHIAFLRRCLSIASAAFFDDTGIVDLRASARSAQLRVQFTFGAAGTKLDPEKSQTMATQRVYLGLSVNVGMASSHGVVTFDLKPGFQHGTDIIVNEAFDREKCTSGTASSLRGRFGWAASASFGRCARGGQSALLQRQYHDTVDNLTTELSHDLIFHKLLPTIVGQRRVPILMLRRHLSLIYSDASYEVSEPNPAKLGLVCFDQGCAKPLGLAAIVEDSELACLLFRLQQITACEMLPPLYFLASHPDLVRGRDFLWWIDNQSSVSLLVKGAGSQSDLASIAAAVHLAAAKLSCRLWFEWVPMDSNCSDGLSRDGVLDSWSLQQDWKLEVWRPPRMLDVVCRSLVEFASAL